MAVDETATLVSGLYRRVSALEEARYKDIVNGGSGGGGKVSSRDFDPTERMVDIHGLVNLDKSQKGSRIPLTANLPTQATILIDNREYYLANRVTFVAADWVSNELKLYIPTAHIIYTTYVDDKPPIVEVYERTGSSGSYVYTKVSIEFTATYGFLAAKLVGSTLAESSGGAWALITDGMFAIDIDGRRQEISGLDFSGDSTMAMVAITITSGLTGATCTWDTDHFIIESGASSEYSDVSFAKDTGVATGTNISGAAYLACRKGDSGAARTLGQDGTWQVTLTKDPAVSTFAGLIEVG